MSRSLCTICLRFKLRALMMDGVGMVGKDADVWLLIKSICWNSLLSAHWSRLFTHWQTRSHLRFTKSKRNCKSQTLNQIYTKGRVGVGWGGVGRRGMRVEDWEGTWGGQVDGGQKVFSWTGVFLLLINNEGISTFSGNCPSGMDAGRHTQKDRVKLVFRQTDRVFLLVWET